MGKEKNIIIYNTVDGKASVALYAKDGMIWMNQNQLVVIFLETAELRLKERMDVTMVFWMGNVDKLLEFNNKSLLKGKGSISNKTMEQKVREIYSNFDQRRKNYEAQDADENDLLELTQLADKFKNNTQY